MEIYIVQENYWYTDYENESEERHSHDILGIYQTLEKAVKRILKDIIQRDDSELYGLEPIDDDDKKRRLYDYDILIGDTDTEEVDYVSRMGYMDIFEELLKQ